ncbi:MAG: hypothetical protein AAF602_00715 [Myxococcota bacterium]
MSDRAGEHSEMMRRWWVHLPLDHPFVQVIRQLAGDLPDRLQARVRRRSGPPRERRDRGPHR